MQEGVWRLLALVFAAAVKPACLQGDPAPYGHTYPGAYAKSNSSNGLPKGLLHAWYVLNIQWVGNLTFSFLGGVISLLALHGLFILITKHNLCVIPFQFYLSPLLCLTIGNSCRDYPDFYANLYRLFQPNIFYVKYRAKFLKLATLFLTSSYALLAPLHYIKNDTTDTLLLKAFAGLPGGSVCKEDGAPRPHCTSRRRSLWHRVCLQSSQETSAVSIASQQRSEQRGTCRLWS